MMHALRQNLNSLAAAAPLLAAPASLPVCIYLFMYLVIECINE